MEYTKLGKSDITISKLCVGCMSFGKPSADFHEWTLNPQDTENMVRHALELGINFFDTANTYAHGTSEEYLGRAIRKNVVRDKVVLASKVYFNEGHLSKEAINREIDGTLKRLDTDYLDLYIIHRFDYETPIEETMEALHGLVKAGKVRALGASAMYGYQFHNMQFAAAQNGWTPFVSMQNHYNLLYREDERELIPVCKQMNVSLTPYSPLAAGRLCRKEWHTDTKRSMTDRMAADKYDGTESEDYKIVFRVAELAEKYEKTMTQIALAWQFATKYKMTDISKGNIRTKFFAYANDCYIEMINANDAAAECFSVKINGGQEIADRDRMFEVFAETLKVLDSTITEDIITKTVDYLKSEQYMVSDYIISDTVTVETYVPIVELSYGKNSCRIDVISSDYR